MIGNVKGVSQVNYDIKSTKDSQPVEISQEVVTDAPVVAAATPTTSTDELKVESVYYEIQSGDTLSAVAKKFYGDANSYNKIFEANKEVILNVDKIYPGQRIRIPQ